MAQFIAQFKKVSDKNSARFGQKREAFTVTYADPVVSEIPEPQLMVILKDSLDAFGKRLIAENASDWSYVPAPEAITVEALFNDLSKPSGRGARVFTNANIEAFASEVYAVSMVQEHGKSDLQAKTGAQMLNAKLAPMLAKPKMLEGMQTNLMNIAMGDIYANAVAQNPTHELVMAKFLEMIEEVLAANRAELTEDAI